GGRSDGVRAQRHSPPEITYQRIEGGSVMAQLIGLARIGRDVELRYTTDGTQVASLSLAFSYGKKDPNTGNKPTQWVDASLWGQRAEALAPYLLKGTQIHVTIDDPHIATFQRQDGTQGSKLAGRISNLEFTSSPLGAAQGSAPTQQPQRPQQAQQQGDYANRRSNPPPQQ